MIDRYIKGTDNTDLVFLSSVFISEAHNSITRVIKIEKNGKKLSPIYITAMIAGAPTTLTSNLDDLLVSINYI